MPEGINNGDPDSTPRSLGSGILLETPHQKRWARHPALWELVADVAAIADRLHAQTFHLVGHDGGGVVVWPLAGQQPERVATLTAVSTPHPRAFARVLVGIQGLRSAYLPVFRLPRLPEHHAGELGRLLLEHLRRWNARPADPRGRGR